MCESPRAPLPNRVSIIFALRDLQLWCRPHSVLPTRLRALAGFRPRVPRTSNWHGSRSLCRTLIFISSNHTNRSNVRSAQPRKHGPYFRPNPRAHVLGDHGPTGGERRAQHVQNGRAASRHRRPSRVQPQRLSPPHRSSNGPWATIWISISDGVGRWCCKRHLCVEPAMCWARLGGSLRVRVSTCPHPLSRHGARLLGHHHWCAIAVTPAVIAALAASAASQTSAAWLARRAPWPQALPPPTGLWTGS